MGRRWRLRVLNGREQENHSDLDPDAVKIVQRREGRVLIDPERLDSDVVVVEGIQRMRDGVDVTYEPVGLAERSGDLSTVLTRGRAAAGAD